MSQLPALGVALGLGLGLSLVLASAPAAEAGSDGGSTTAQLPSGSDAWFTSHTGGFKIHFAPGWFFGAGPAPANCTGWAPDDLYSKAPGTEFSVVVRDLAHSDLAATDQATEMLKLSQEALQKTLAGYRWDDSGDLTMPAGNLTGTKAAPGGAAAPAGKYLLYTFNEGGHELAGVVYFLILPKRQIICHGRCLKARLDAMRKLFDSMVQSIQVTGPTASPWTRSTPPAENGTGAGAATVESAAATFHDDDLGCALQVPADFRPEQVGAVTLFHAPPTAAAADAGSDIAGPQLTVSSEILPAALSWDVYLETLKSRLRERLQGFQPGADTAFTASTSAAEPPTGDAVAEPAANGATTGTSPSADTDADRGEVHLFEYTQQVGGSTVKACMLVWLRPHAVLVVTGSAPAAGYAAARKELFMPAFSSLTWTPTGTSNN
ncbi:MAG: hypothetical protein ACREJ2_00680 [Planctomycetota bacterium]